MFAKSTITLFVLAVGLSSLLSGNGIGSASAYPQPDETSIILDLDDPNQSKVFEDIMREGNKFRALTILNDNVIQGSKTGKNYMGSEVKQSHIMVRGKLPEGRHTYGGVTYLSNNAIQQSDSSGKNYLGSRLVQEDITYNVKD